jgi:hypothetical protein
MGSMAWTRFFWSIARATDEPDSRLRRRLATSEQLQVRQALAFRSRVPRSASVNFIRLFSSRRTVFAVSDSALVLDNRFAEGAPVILTGRVNRCGCNHADRCSKARNDRRFSASDNTGANEWR